MKRQRPTIKLRSQHLTLEVPLGDGPVVPTGGGLTIEELARPGRIPLTNVTGQSLIALDVPAFWDGLAGGEKTNVKPDVEDVLDLATTLPEIDFTAEGPMPYSGYRFVMTFPEWTTLQPFPSGQGWLQVGLTLKLVEYVDPRAINSHKKYKRGRFGEGSDGGTRAPAAIVLPKPMNLVEVAAKYAGDPGEAKKIGKANGIHDIKTKLPKGRHLVIPAG